VSETITCVRCGYQRPVEGPLLAEDGTELTLEQYLEMLGLLAGNLVCAECTTDADEQIGTLG